MTSHPDEDLPVVYFQDGTYGETPSCISPQILAALTAYFGGPFKFFAMQSAVVSHIVHFAVNVKRVGDVVVRSPTGSGKTLAFAIPIVERLLRRAVPRLRAVIVVPTHDLATQVAAVFSALTKGTDITVALATGAVTVASEADAAAAAEVLIATPGRLIDHVENTPGVTLAHVEFLVLDESDRLLQDAYYSWADIVLPRCGIPQPAEDGEEGEVALPCSGILAMAIPATVRPRPGFGGRVSLTRKILVSATATRDPQRLAKLKLQRVTYFEPVSSKAVTSEKGETDESPKDGEGEKQYSVPHKLDECAFVLPSSRHKPMALLSILGWNTGVQPTEKNSASSIQSVSKLGSKLVFTKSVESAHRLARLLELFSRQQETEPIVLEISRDVSPKRRSAVLALLKESENASESKPKRPVIVVCSDVFARGMDIPSVEAVISYDAAVQVRTYLHRVGRTARAGRPGIAVTILLAKQVRHFKSMVRDVDRGKKKCKIRDVHIDGLRDSQQAALLSRRLSALKRVLRRESLGLLKTGECLPGHLLVEMSTDDATVLKQHAARKRARTATDVGFNSAKRARVDSGMNGEEHEGNEDVRVQDTAERRWREDEDGENGAGEDDDDASSIGGDSDLGEDSFQDILRAYVASNWLSERSKV